MSGIRQSQATGHKGSSFQNAERLSVAITSDSSKLPAPSEKSSTLRSEAHTYEGLREVVKSKGKAQVTTVFFCGLKIPEKIWANLSSSTPFRVEYLDDSREAKADDGTLGSVSSARKQPAKHSRATKVEASAKVVKRVSRAKTTRPRVTKPRQSRKSSVDITVKYPIYEPEYV